MLKVTVFDRSYGAYEQTEFQVGTRSFVLHPISIRVLKELDVVSACRLVRDLTGADLAQSKALWDEIKRLNG
jgi:hypothetical protein